MEEAELTEVLRSALSDQASKSYRRLLDALFNQRVAPAMDFAYDDELYKVQTCVKSN